METQVQPQPGKSFPLVAPPGYSGRVDLIGERTVTVPEPSSAISILLFGMVLSYILLFKNKNNKTIRL